MRLKSAETPQVPVVEFRIPLQIETAAAGNQKNEMNNGEGDPIPDKIGENGDTEKEKSAFQHPEGVFVFRKYFDSKKPIHLRCFLFTELILELRRGWGSTLRNSVDRYSAAFIPFLCTGRPGVNSGLRLSVPF